MPRAPDEILSAQVVLRPATDRGPKEPITSQNVSEIAPSADVVTRVRKAFADAGFDVGPFVGSSFSIAGHARTFQKVFKARIGRQPSELPLTGLPRDLREEVDAVTFTPPPDFGPTSY